MMNSCEQTPYQSCDYQQQPKIDSPLVAAATELDALLLTWLFTILDVRGVKASTPERTNSRVSVTAQ